MSQTKINVGMIDATSIGDAKLLQGDGAWITPAVAGFTLGTEQAVTSGTGVTFGSIPAGVKQIDIMFHEVSTSSTTLGDDILIQIGDAGGLETSGYLSAGASLFQHLWYSYHDAVGFQLFTYAEVAHTEQLISGVMSLHLEDSANFSWVSAGTYKQSAETAENMAVSAGSKSLSAELTQLKVGIEDGTFDAGAINIKYM
jgi:hypothetical protein